MLFNSWLFILAFLPATLIVYFFLSHRCRLLSAAKAWLVASSLAFYGFWSIFLLPLIISSILFNFFIGRALTAQHDHNKWAFSSKAVLTVGIGLNLCLLAYFKYRGFFIENVNYILDTQNPIQSVIPPLAISFFTFQQIAYLVDSYRGETVEYGFLNYALFVTFFPQLIAGPIVHHRQMMPQFSSRWNSAPRYRLIFKGLLIFSIGLFKKVAIADTFAVWATEGFDSGQQLDFYSAWSTSLSYTFQLYFDFSAYCDMAIGIALLFNIRLPLNFNSPYRAQNVQDFWRRWHITLGRFLRDYLYIPLGGNQGPAINSALAIMTTFLLGGLWHGASWMFVIWGGLHGVAMIVYRLWRSLNRPMPASMGWLVTFLFVNTTWVFFRANSLADAERVLRGMADFGSVFATPVDSIPTAGLAWGGWFSDVLLSIFTNGLVPYLASYAMIAVAFGMIFQKNSFELMSESGGWGTLVAGVSLLGTSMYFILASTSQIFLYFHF